MRALLGWLGLWILGLVIVGCGAQQAASAAPNPAVLAAQTAAVAATQTTWTPQPWQLTATAGVLLQGTSTALVAATRTQEAQDQATMVAFARTATQEARPTLTPTVDPTTAAAPRGMQTAIAVIPRLDASKPPEYLDPRDLAANPDELAGKYIFLQGKALTVQRQGDATWFQLMAQPKDRDSVSESISVMLLNSSTTVRRDDCYRVAGLTAGSDTTTLTLTGVQRKVPLLVGLAVISSPRGRSNIGCLSPSG